MSVEVKALVAPPKVSMIFSISFSRAMRGAAAGHDVLQHVAQAGPEVLALVGAAGVLDEAPHRGHRRHVVLLHDHRQPVGERGQGDVLGQPQQAGVAGRLPARPPAAILSQRQTKRPTPYTHGCAPFSSSLALRDSSIRDVMS